MCGGLVVNLGCGLTSWGVQSTAIDGGTQGALIGPVAYILGQLMLDLGKHSLVWGLAA